MTRPRTTLPALCAAALLAALPVATRAEEPPPLLRNPALVDSKPFQRWLWLWEDRASPLGFVPPGALERARRQIAAHQRAHPPQRTFVTPWAPLGPAPILGGQIGATGGTRPMSGRVVDIAVDPGNNAHWLIGAAQGGIWETSDSGTTWAPRSDDQASLAMGSLAFAAGLPAVVYAGTGESAFAADSYGGQGILKSTDGGTTWSLVATSDFVGNAVADVKVSPTDEDVVLVATTTGVGGRVGTRPTAVPPQGIYRSTDGGSSWSLVLAGQATDIEVDATDFANQFAGLGDVNGGGANGVYRSTDGGQTWNPLSGPWTALGAGLGRVELASAPSDPNTLYVSIQDAFNGVGTDGALLGLWKSTDALAPTPSFTAVNTAPTGTGGYCGFDLAFASASNQCWYSHEISVDPTNANVLWAGGVPLWRFDGSTWTEVSKTASSPANGIHVDQHGMAWAGSRLIAANDGGVWSTTDNGATWTDHNTNLELTQYYDGSLHRRTTVKRMLGGSQDNGTHVWDGSPAWTWIFGGDGADNVVSRDDPNNDWLVSTQRLNLSRTTNGGASFTSANGGLDRTNAPFIARVEACPASADVMLAGTDNLWRANAFFSGTVAFTTNGPEMSQGLSALAFAPSDTSCGTYAFGCRATASVGVNFGALRVTTNGGTSWSDLDPANQVPNRAITDIAFDPANGNVAYVTLSGFDEGTPGEPGHVFKSTNALSGSATWTDVSPPANLPANSLVIDPKDSATLYLGTDMGVWYSTDAGASWTHFGPADGMPNVAVFELEMDPRGERLVAFTHGRGAFIRTDLLFADGFEAGTTGNWSLTVP